MVELHGLYLTFKYIAKGVVLFTSLSHPRSVWGPSSSISSSILDMVFLFKFSNPARCTMRLTLVLICISLILNSVEHILMNWVVISSLERCLFSLFLPIFNCCYFLSDYCQSSLYILHTSPLSGIIGKHQANISHL